MADDTRSSSSGDGTVGGAPDRYDTAPGARPPAAGGLNAAWGRTSADLATDQPAGHAAAGLRSDPDLLAGSDDVTGGLGGTKIDPDAGGDIRRGRHRELHPEVDPDTRLGLRPTVSADRLPDQPADAPIDPRTRAATGAVAGLAGAAVVAALMYALFWSGQLAAPTFLAAERTLLGTRGWLDHAFAVLGFLAAGGIWGWLFGLLVPRPTLLAGVAFGLLPALFHWLVIAPLIGDGLFNRGTAAGVALPLLFNALVWGGIVGHLCHRWLRPPYDAVTTSAVG
ncbi:MAG: hypothetical protein AVDCRST_MAG64-2421 [uncultured Phycisphaerae bacterium]|uniref:Uncharacterized protein n=1 Tax=uncultured Phycisphaerae bacterium TaxID=904963 RepID=A0A6J4PJH7_9BACT|nr:MAG: hypothetical protein AVDCRST_MAG64-2421 [uncultured Phycisphaerae bacterium]